MVRQRLMNVEGSSWFEIGKDLAEKVSSRSFYAYQFDRAAYCDEPDIKALWTEHLGPMAEKSMAMLTPNAYELCRGFDTVFKIKGDKYSVWELLTLYEVDMFIHEFHYKCSECKHRIMKGPRYVCAHCEPTQPDSSPKKRSRNAKAIPSSICLSCVTTHPGCVACGNTLEATSVLHETMGIGIANKSGCTGFGYRDDQMFFCGQTLEMATDTYNYGRFDTVYKLHNTESNITVLVYDVGCILSPFGVNSSGLGLCVFNLYNSDYCLPPYAENDYRVPMAALQWEILLRGSHNVNETLSFLRGPANSLKTFTSASFIVAAADDCSVIEVTANNSWIPALPESETEDNQAPAVFRGNNGSKWIVRANNCLAGSSLLDTESLPPNISSKDRQADLARSFSTLEGAQPDLDWIMTALSTPTIQTEYCLSTVIMEPEIRKMHVRFRVGTRMSTTLKDGGRWDVFSI